MNKVKIFISQPMNGKSYQQILTDRQKIVNELHTLWVDTDIEILNTVFEDISDHEPLWYLGLAIQALSEANLAVFSPGWKTARGCQIEYKCAFDYRIPILLLEDNLYD